jgi:hypothetical protein
MGQTIERAGSAMKHGSLLKVAKGGSLLLWITLDRSIRGFEPVASAA